MEVFLILKLRSDILQVSAFLNTFFRYLKCSLLQSPVQLFVEFCSANIFLIELFPPQDSVLAMYCKSRYHLQVFRVVLQSVQFKNTVTQQYSLVGFLLKLLLKEEDFQNFFVQRVSYTFCKDLQEEVASSVKENGYIGSSREAFKNIEYLTLFLKNN